MSKEKSPAYQQYPSDYLSDFKVQAMTLEEEGMYVRLMQYCWKEVSLPNDPEILKSLCKGKHPTAMVLSCFSDDGCGNLRHKRLDEERKKQEENVQRRSIAGQKGNEKRWGKRKKTHKKIANGSQCDNLAIANGSQNVALQSSISSSISSSNIKRERGVKSHICPDSFSPSDQDMRWAIETRPDLDVERETLKFRNYEFKNPKSDWLRTWKNWILNAEAKQSNKPQRVFEVLA